VSSRGPGIVKRLQLREGVLREGLASVRRGEKFVAARPSVVLLEKLKSCAGLEAMRAEVRAADTMANFPCATSRSETCSNQRESILQRPFSSASPADANGDVKARKAGEKASDAMQNRVW
jgi:hypothetical protein